MASEAGGTMVMVDISSELRVKTALSEFGSVVKESKPGTKVLQVSVSRQSVLCAWVIWAGRPICELLV